MYVLLARPATRQGMGDPATDLLSTLSTPSSSTGLSPLWMAGLGLLALVYFMRSGKRVVRSYKRKARQREQKQQRIRSLESELERARQS